MEQLKIFRICPAPGQLSAFRQLHRLKEKSFTEQIRLLRTENYLLPGGWAAVMEEEGFEVFETLYNDWELQSRWAYEHQKEKIILAKNWEFKLLLEQVWEFQPNVISRLCRRSIFDSRAAPRAASSGLQK